MIRKITPASEMIINLDGPKGNAFHLMKVAKELAHFEDKGVTMIMSEMCGDADYFKLVKVFDKHFGHLVVLESSNEKLLEFVNAD